ncbi:MAG: FAD binding domain-containing protein [Nitrospinota bacterium]
MRNFELISPRTIEEACDALHEHADHGKILAGGLALLIVMKQGVFSPECLIDIGEIGDLNHVRANKDHLSIGAMTPHRTIETHPEVASGFPLLQRVFGSVGTIRIRNQGTIGGNLCFAEPAADPPAALMVMEAELVARKKGGNRTIPIGGFFTGYYETALEPDELLTEIRVPRLPEGWRTAYTKFTTRSKEDKPALSVAAAVELEADGKTCRDVRICVGAAVATPRRMSEAEAFLRGKELTDAVLREAGEVAKAAVEPIADIRGSAEYRREMVGVFLRRTVQAAVAGDSH